MSPLSAADIYEHPEFDGVIWKVKPALEGKATVAAGRRGGPLQLAYEIHGEGPTRLVWIIGLGGWMSAWQRQIKDFGHSQNTNRGQSSKYTNLIFDPRGMGKSDKPLTRYSTSEMAKDTLELIDHVGWTRTRQLHVIGSSMGGMIAQELACIVPERIASLTLLASAPRIFNTIGWVQNLRDRINLLYVQCRRLNFGTDGVTRIPKEIDTQVEDTKQRLFSSEWLNEPDSEGHFPTNGDRFKAYELKKRQDPEGYTRKGFLMQALAAGWHNVSPRQLRNLSEQVGGERIQVIHGTADRMLPFPLGETLAKELGQVTFIVVDGRSHALQWEWRRGLTKAVAALVEKAEIMTTG
ncbi:uncharacterized protein KY384_001049 [Bacidia gigantensis]|uniref:uncharacterized protein n=1 Tax=Bacidia gigantensis TaxID=2732470 RepID=UPI001D040B56|nr:uncharacterized protein KY384_001049 [Bacidia gigantensis]KAG8534205.1 hypothetical protein KY384_001049 [Bacidia gigantensis]